MALDFPTSPTNGQVYGNFVYSSSKGAWQAKPITGKVTTSATAPSTPTNGDEWFNTNDGNLYVYYTDVDGSQWVQVKSDATLSSTLGNRVTTLETYPSGLVPMTPASVVVSSGSATIGANGSVSFTNVNSVSLNNVFTSAYKNYKVLVTITSAANNTSVDYRFRSAGVDWAGGSGYIFCGTEGATAGGSFGNRYSNGQSTFSFGYAYTTFGNDTEMDIKNVSVSGLETTFLGQCMSQLSSGNYGHNMTGRSNGNTNALDGITVIGASYAISGNIQVYGYR